MRSIVRSSVLTAAAVAAAIGFAGSASAAPTWTVTPGGTFTGTAGTTTLKDTNTGTSVTCTSSTATGSAVAGSGQSGTGLGKINSISFTSCKGPLSFTFTVTSSHLPWNINAVSYVASTGTTTGTITGISAHLAGATCSADIDGTGGAGSGTGTVNLSYVNSTHKMTISGGGLTVYNSAGCLGLLNNGNTATFSSVYTLSPALTITSP